MRLGAIILAAGAGTRLNSGQPSVKPKVLYEIGSKPMVSYTLELLTQLGISEQVMVVGYQEAMVRNYFGDKVKYASQPERKGTAHAAKLGEEKLDPEITHLLIIQGDDSAFYKKETIQKFIEEAENYQIGFTTIKLENPGQYGRVIRSDQGNVSAIVEKESLTEAQKEINEVNAATYFVDRVWFNQVYPTLRPSAVGKGELIMPDLISIAFDHNLKVLGFEVPKAEWVGVNTPDELALADKLKRGGLVAMKKVHFMGLGGAGISAVASFAKAEGFEVSGCDIDTSSPFLKEILDKKIPFFPEHDKNHLDNIDYLVISPAIGSLDPNNSEVAFAREKNITVTIGEEFLTKYLLGNKKVIAVSGTHGKSTTTAMIGKILEDARLDPSVMVGAIVSDWETNYRVGKGDYFVVEADEYQEKFLLYHPTISVITAIEMDHPEYFKDLTAVKSAFQKFVENTTDEGYVILGETLDLKVSNSKLLVLGKDFQKEHFDLKLIGEFNQENASLAFEVAKIIGIDSKVAKAALESFSGVGRRFELKGEKAGIKVFDDYGHHPSAIKATVEAAKEKFPNNRIFLVYQPHMFSRTKYLFNSFVEVFKNLNIEQTVLVDIYAARQENTENISSQDVVKAVNLPNTKYIGDFEQTVSSLVNELNPGDIVIVMGAGDIFKLSTLLLNKLNGKNR